MASPIVNEWPIDAIVSVNQPRKNGASQSARTQWNVERNSDIGRLIRSFPAKLEKEEFSRSSNARAENGSTFFSLTSKQRPLFAFFCHFSKVSLSICVKA